MAKYRCLICDWVYDSESGDPEAGVPAETLFERIMDDWKCPVCGADKQQFEKI